MSAAEYRYEYGDDNVNQYIRLHIPPSSSQSLFVIIHGGYWKSKYSMDNSG
jgi:hypothetical protein